MSEILSEKQDNMTQTDDAMDGPITKTEKLDDSDDFELKNIH